MMYNHQVGPKLDTVFLLSSAKIQTRSGLVRSTSATSVHPIIAILIFARFHVTVPANLVVEGICRWQVANEFDQV